MKNKALVLRIVGASVAEILACRDEVRHEIADLGIDNAGNGQYDWDIIDTAAQSVDDPAVSFSALRTLAGETTAGL